MRGKNLLIFALGIAVILPMTGLNTYFLSLLVTALITALYTLSWDLIGGAAGQISLGQALFFGVGTYGFAIFSHRFGVLPAFFTTLLLSIALGALAGTAAVRLRGALFALFTLCLAEILHEISLNVPIPWKGLVAGGEGGIPFLNGSGVLERNGISLEYYLYLGLTVVAVTALLRFLSRPEGLTLKAIAENELLARASGINVEKFKLAAFIVSGTMATLAGMLFVIHTGRATPADFSLELSFQAATLSAIGGRGSVTGPAMAAFLLTFAFSALEIPPQVKLSVYSLLLPIILLKLPQRALGAISGEKRKSRAQ